MAEQIPKQKIDVGQIGNASTGDILFDGGNKINDNIANMYNAFGDQRFVTDGTDIGNMTIHATGYYQKVDSSAFRTAVPVGTQWDVDTKGESVVCTIEQARRGEIVRFMNSNGSISVNSPLNIQAAGGTFVGVSGPLKITTPYTHITCVCVEEGANTVWNYSVENMFGTNLSPVEGTYLLTATNSNIRLAHSSDFNSMKLLLIATDNTDTKMRQSEVNLLCGGTVNNKQVYHTEYAVQRVGNLDEHTDDLIALSFVIDANGYVNAVLNTKYTGVKIAIKSLAMQRVGSL